MYVSVYVVDNPYNILVVIINVDLPNTVVNVDNINNPLLLRVIMTA